ncbi:hypothetical protein J6590_046582 [Homalodisca vitripennis]|nr:hypothetical protein J6590_046582 [Homalodisca vitripennis]
MGKIAHHSRYLDVPRYRATNLFNMLQEIVRQRVRGENDTDATMRGPRTRYKGKNCDRNYKWNYELLTFALASRQTEFSGWVRLIVGMPSVEIPRKGIVDSISHHVKARFRVATPFSTKSALLTPTFVPLRQARPVDQPFYSHMNVNDTLDFAVPSVDSTGSYKTTRSKPSYIQVLKDCSDQPLQCHTNLVYNVYCLQLGTRNAGDSRGKPRGRNGTLRSQPERRKDEIMPGVRSEVVMSAGLNWFYVTEQQQHEEDAVYIQFPLDGLVTLSFCHIRKWIVQKCHFR